MAKVDTRVESTKNGRRRRLRISYVMHLEGDTWTCRNIITDGVSLASNYRYDFGRILRAGGIDALIARLHAKLDEVAQAE